MIRGALTALVALAAAAGGAAAQDDCFPGKSSNEARMMARFDVPLAFGPVAAPHRQPGGIALGLELTYVPGVNPALAIPRECRPSKLRPENTNLVSVLPRPRIWLGLPAGFGVETSWVPPLRIAAAKANLVSVAVSRVTPLRRNAAVLGIRAHATFGVINGPITCNDEALKDAASDCYQGTRSGDAFHPNVFGVEAAVGWRLGRSISPYMGAGYNRLAPRFGVNFTNQFGQTDRRRVSVDLDRGVLFAGATWRATPAFALSGEVYSAPSDAVTARMAARILLGRK